MGETRTLDMHIAAIREKSNKQEEKTVSLPSAV